MYESFFGLKENPFNLTPDPRYLFLSGSHKEALAHLMYGINERRGFIEILGGIGTGKTTLCKALLERIDSKTKTALVLNSYVSELELLRTINEEFGLKNGGQTKKELIDELNRFLIAQLTDGGNAVLIIDESQNLDYPVLEQIRMLSNLETDNEKLIQIILVGQPELHDILTRPELLQLDERITVRSMIYPLTEEETKIYIYHRLAIAGSQGNIKYTPSAFKEIYDYSHGNPRRINNLCDRTLLIAYTKETHRIHKNFVKQAIREISSVHLIDRKVEKEKKRNYFHLSWIMIIAALSLCAIVFGVSFFFFKSENLLKKAPSTNVFRKKVETSGLEPVTLNPHINPVKNNTHVDSYLSFPTAFESLFHLYGKKLDINLSNEKGMESEEFSRMVVPLLKEKGYGTVLLGLSTHQLSTLRFPFIIEVFEHNLNRLHYMVIGKMREDNSYAYHPQKGKIPLKREWYNDVWYGKTIMCFPEIGEGKIFTRFMKGPNVRLIQGCLKETGYYDSKITGTFDQKTSLAVRQLQRDYNLTVDGMVGPQTTAILHQLTGKNPLEF
ncbi:MAG: AAA family ATPase [Thermodesulfobacteriota bacterium]|nr:AAA family ATPase [Thermodesulfobacteriota bacterium]